MRSSLRHAAAGMLSCSVALAACGAADPTAPGVFGDLGSVMPVATPDQKAAFERGEAVALRRFTRAEGLGPAFNATSCAGCHERPATGGAAARYRGTFLVGQSRSDGSFTPLGQDGVLDQLTLDPQTRVPTPAQANVIAPRKPIAFFGAGLIAELTDAEILTHADPEDADQDGIRGRPSYDGAVVGRFGRKAQFASLERLVRESLFDHCGVTTNPLSAASRAKLPVVSPRLAPPGAAMTDDDGAPDPEMSEQDVLDLVSYAMLLAAPRPDDPTPQSEAGKTLFVSARCAGCHVPSLSGPRGLVPLYSDLLLHDMGPGLADGFAVGVAGGSDFRTQPLWGVGAEGPYLHDGRADTLDQAIRMHGGEAAASRDAYAAMSPQDQGLVLAFLLSLGGRSQSSAGLLAPNAPVPAAGAFGGPAAPLSGDDLVRFVSGRAVFDRDTSLAGGLGPLFNGDSCRACHADPVLGGAGSNDVDVVRQGFADSNGFVAPPAGTMLPRLSVAGVRPEPWPSSDVFEARQPPLIFGLGLVDRIDDATILSHEDPTDANGDGVRGRANRLPDGRIGRFGWKASVPSLNEFARDALSTEMGVTVPAQPGLTFGATSDADGSPDPEIPQADLDALVYFMQQLAPPPRTSTMPSQELAGSLVFVKVGCATCHVPAMPTRDGVDAFVYSDLLLHDVASAGSVGVAEGSATMTELRTPPLWGLAKTAPYMHDGRAFTIEEAVLAHDGEAKGARASFAALSSADHDALIAFLSSL